MLVLIATEELQGTSPYDHHCAIDGELVTPNVLLCGNPRCQACERGWFGLASLGITTTAMVVERPGVTVADLRRRIHDWLDDLGTIDQVHQAHHHGHLDWQGFDVADPVAAVATIVDAHVGEITEVCANFAVGTTVSRLGSLVSMRHFAAAA
jgi:hypothetical protein